jgi:hypothetical protein
MKLAGNPASSPLNMCKPGFAVTSRLQFLEFAPVLSYAQEFGLMRFL